MQHSLLKRQPRHVQLRCRGAVQSGLLQLQGVPHPQVDRSWVQAGCKAGRKAGRKAGHKAAARMTAEVCTAAPHIQAAACTEESHRTVPADAGILVGAPAAAEVVRCTVRPGCVTARTAAGPAAAACLAMEGRSGRTGSPYGCWRRTQAAQASYLKRKCVLETQPASVPAGESVLGLACNTAPRSTNHASQQQPTSLYAQHNLFYKHCNTPTLLGMKEHERRQCNTQQKVCRRITDWFPRFCSSYYYSYNACEIRHCANKN